MSRAAERGILAEDVFGGKNNNRYQLTLDMGEQSINVKCAILYSFDDKNVMWHLFEWEATTHEAN